MIVIKKEIIIPAGLQLHASSSGTEFFAYPVNMLKIAIESRDIKCCCGEPYNLIEDVPEIRKSEALDELLKKFGHQNLINFLLSDINNMEAFLKRTGMIK